jgi:hypothetical protein
MTTAVFEHINTYSASDDKITGIGASDSYTVTFSNSITPGDTIHYTFDGGSFSGTYIGTNPHDDLIFQEDGIHLVLTNHVYSIGDPIVVKSEDSFASPQARSSARHLGTRRSRPSRSAMSSSRVRARCAGSNGWGTETLISG